MNLFSKEEPLLAVYFHNAWEPFRSNKEVVKNGVNDVKKLGFNTIILESKPWQDYFMKYKTNFTSDYIAMQEYIRDCAQKKGLCISCFSVWHYGDNMVEMGLRKYPINYGETITWPIKRTGLPLIYKYWSPKTQKIMVEHHLGLTKVFKPDFCLIAHKSKKKFFLITIGDPIVYPSFDKDGINRYKKWLVARYRNISALNKAYQTRYSNFGEIKPKDYWAFFDRIVNPDLLPFWFPDEEDFNKKPILIKKWVDNQLWRRDELINYFSSIKKIHTIKKSNCLLIPNLQQWRIFFNDYKWWWTPYRALDPWLIKEHCDVVTFITSPADPYSRPDAYVVSAEASILRSINKGHIPLAGLYLGRYLLEDIYSTVSPAEAIGTLLAHGARALHIYGYNGIDDGGTLFKLSELQRESIRDGLKWFKKIVGKLTQPRRKDIAILFPLAMSLLDFIPSRKQMDDPFIERNSKSSNIDNAINRRMNILGWFKHLTDAGYMVDFLHPTQVKEGELKNYFALIIPYDPKYKYMLDLEMEEKIIKWVKSGGVVLHDPNNEFLPAILRPQEMPHSLQCIRCPDGELLLPEGISSSYFKNIEPLARYEDNKIAIGKRDYGQGLIYSFGFNVGYAYTKKTLPRVESGTQDHYPLPLLKESLIHNLLSVHKSPRFGRNFYMKGIEVSDFRDSLVIINHTSIPFRLDQLKIVDIIHQDGRNKMKRLLLPHAAAYISLK